MKSRFILVLIISGIFLNLQSANVIFKVVTPAYTKECRIVGNFNNWNILESIPGVQNSDNSFTFALNDSIWAKDITKSNLRYMYVNCNCDWSICAERKKSGEFADHRTFTDNTTDTVQRWGTNQFHGEFFIRVKTPPGTKECYMIGNTNNWQQPDETTKLDFVEKDLTDSVIFKYNLPFQIYTCIVNDFKYQFCCGPSKDYIQSLPTDTFLVSKTIFPSIRSWKKLYLSTLDATDKTVKITVHEQHVYVSGLKEDDQIYMFEMSGKLYNFTNINKSNITFDIDRHGIFYFRILNKTTKTGYVIRTII